ncbi:Phosphoglycolate phosphatase [subsurface metagenome]
MWEALYKQYGEPPDYKLLEEWENIYWAQVEVDMKLFPETEGVLEQLSSKYQLAVISNAPSLGSARKLYAGELSKIERFFKNIFIAGQAGVPPKPAPEPFQQCLTSLGLTPSEAVYVGDDWDMDICGARDAGIQPIWIKHRSVDRSWPPDEKTVPIITTLEPLLELETILSASDIQLQNSG